MQMLGVEIAAVYVTILSPLSVCEYFLHQCYLLFVYALELNET